MSSEGTPPASRARADRERAADVLEHGDAVYVLDAQFRYVLVNGAQEQSSGKTRDQLLGRCIWDVWPEAASRDLKFWDVYHRVMRERVPEQFEEYFAPLDLWAEVRVFPTQEGGISVFFRRINDRKRAEAALRDEEQKYRSLFEHSLDAVYLTLSDGTILDANRAACLLHGMTVDEIKQAGRAGLVVNDERHAEALKTRAARGQVRAKLTVRRKDGTTVPVEVESVLVDPSRPDSRAFVISRDITERKRAEEALDAERRRWRGVVEGIADEVWACDEAGRMSLMNLPDRTAMGLDEFAGRSIEEVLERLEILHPTGEPRSPQDAPLLRSLRTGEIVRGEEMMRDRASGRLRHRQYSCAPIRDGDGRVAGAVAIVRDITAQKNAEQALKARDAQFRALLRELRSGVALVDASGRFSVYNSRFLELFGLAQDDIGNINDHDWSNWQVVDENERVLHVDEHPVRKASLTREPVRNKLVGVRSPSGGDLVWMLVSAEPLLSSDGTIEQIICTYHDITDRRRAEQALRESEEKSRSVIENLSEGLMLFDANGNTFLQNPASLRIHGFDATEGRRQRDDLPVTWRGWDIQGRPLPFEEWPISRVLRGEHFQEQVLRAQRVETGHEFYASYNGCPIRDATGKLVYGFITIRDITEQVRAREEQTRAEQALRESGERLRALADSMPQLAWMARPDGYITWYNRRWYEYTGTTPEQMEGWGWQSVHDPATLPEVMTRWTASIASGNEFEMEFPIRGADGVFRRFLTRAFPLKDPQGTVLQWFGTNTDVTELVEAQVRLREADRRKDEFLGMLSHELRNPLAPIRNSIYILRHTGVGSDQAARAHHVIERQTEHLTRLVDDLLDVTRIARGKIELRRSRVDLREVVSRAAEDFRLLLHDRGIEFRVELPDVTVWADADPTRITQVVGNLLHNASKFTRRGDEVVLSLTRGVRRADIRVADTGVGLEQELLHTVFEPFVQGARTLARTEGGLGLGLALVKGITELHGGTVSAESAGKGKGSEFIVRLPLTSPAADQKPGTGCEPQSRTGARKILVVDDNADAAESLAEIVTLLGHRVELAYDGPSALEKVRANAPDVVLCDIGLPGMSGYEVASAVRASGNAHVELIAVSGYAQPEDIKKALDAGFDGHVAKPPDPLQIQRLLAS